MADIELPNGGKAPLWATEETMKSLLNAVKGSSAFGGGGSAGDDIEELGEAATTSSKKFKDLTNNIFNLYKPGSGALTRMADSAMSISKNFSGSSALQTGLTSVAKGMNLAADAAGAFGPAVQVASYLLGKYAELLGTYLNVLPQAIESGLGFSASLGKSAQIVDKAGISVEDFYKALQETGATYRALGDNAYDAARNFGELQSSIRGTYGTFGQNNAQLAESTASYVKLMAQTGLRGNAAVDAAASTYGNSMEQLRKISIATGTSLKALQGSMKDLMANPIVIAGMNKLGKSTEDAAIKMAKASAGFEAVFGDLGRDLYKQMAEAEAAGLSIINTELGAQLAPFTDLGALTKFNKMLTEGGGTATEMAEAQRQFLASTEANLPTLRLLAQQGDKAASQMLQLYNKAKSAVIMSQDELDAQELKKRGEERLLNIQNKISAAYEKVTAKLFGFLDMIPESAFEHLGTMLEDLGSVLGFAIDALVVAGKVIGTVLDPFARITASIYGLLKWLIFPGDKTFMELVLGPFEGMWDSFVERISDIWDSFTGLFKGFGDGMGILGVAITAIISPFTAIGVVAEKVANWLGQDGLMGALSGLMGWLRNSWLGKKIFGDSGSASETASAPIMDSTPSNTAKSVQDATAAVAVAKAETTRATADKSSEHLERLARIAQESAEQQAVIAKNTGNTVDAVANSTASY